MGLLSELIRYCKDILSGKIVSCLKHRWACQRFLDDLSRAEKSSEDFPYVFVEERAQHYIDWMQEFTHSTGALQGQTKIPVIYEKFVYGNIYGWWSRENAKLRRFRRSYEQIARKNAKSQDKAIQALYETSAFGELRAQNYIAATKKEQTRHVWGEAKWLIENSWLKDRFVCKFDQEYMQVVIKHKKSGSIFARLSKDDKKTGDGTNPHFMIIDEYHLHETTEYYDLATSGMKTRPNSLLSIITTAGFDLNNPCYRVEYDYISQILNPDIPIFNDRYFAIVCEAEKNESPEPIIVNGRKIPSGGLIDDIKSDEARLKSNPVIGTDPTAIESIKMEITEALDKPEKLRDVLTKTLNVWVNQRECGYMDMAKWAACGESDAKKLPDVYGLTPFAGLDLSSVLDLTSCSFVFNLPDGQYYITSHSWIPEETIEKKRKTDKVPYDLWVSQGWITATEGAEVDYHAILEWLDEKYRVNKWRKGEICYDKALATWLTHELQERGYTPIEIAQSYTGLSLATKTLRTKTYNRKIIHANNPVLTWAMSNAITRSGPSENIMLDKSKAKQRIDPVAATINAFVRAMANEQTASIYDKRGMRSLLSDW